VTLRLDTQIRSPLDAVAGELEELVAAGLDGAFTFEGPGDVFHPLVLGAAHTSLDLYTNVAIAFPRSPMHLAHQSWDLQRLSQGRFALGLGSQVRPHIERRYSATWDRPVERMGELIAAVRAVFACWQDGDRLDFRGDHYTLTLMTPTFDPGPLPWGPPPIWVGALGPRMTAMVAEHADGLLIHPFTSRRFLEGHTLPIVAAADRATPLTLVCESIVCAHRTEEERAAAEAGTRWLVGFYGSTPAYRPVLEAEGYGDLQPELNALSKQGRWDEMAGLIDDALLDVVTIRGTPGEVGEAMVARFGDVADRLGFYLPYALADGLLGDVVRAIRAAEAAPAEGAAI
jgi:probable F420-dependent oxidoreductase